MQLDEHPAHQPLIIREHQRLVGADDDHEIIAAREVVLHEAEALAQQTLDAVPPRRRADAPADRDAEARVAQLIRKRVPSQRAARLAHLRIEHGGELQSPAEAVGFGVRVPASSFCHGAIRPDRTIPGVRAMKEWIVNLIESSGYWGIALLMFLENVFPPIPSELIMPLGGFTASQGKLTLPLVSSRGRSARSSANSRSTTSATSSASSA